MPSLLSHGARAVWKDLPELVSRLDNALSIASPSSIDWTWDLLHKLMREALAEARRAMDCGEVPIACVLARGDGSIIARGFNEMNRTKNKTAHAEIVTFAHAAGKVPLEARDLVLVSTLEPCVMCTGAAMEAAVDTIIYALKAPADSGTNRVRPPQSPESQMPRIIGNVLAVESRNLFEFWLAQNSDAPQANYVKQLLLQTE